MNGADRDAEAPGEVLGRNETLIQQSVAATSEPVGASNADDFLRVERLVPPVAVSKLVECIGGLLIRMSLKQFIESGDNFRLGLANHRHGQQPRYRE